VRWGVGGIYLARVRRGLSGPAGPEGGCLCREPSQPALGKEPSLPRVWLLTKTILLKIITKIANRFEKFTKM
jgi:hypothetical protein